MGSSYKFRPLGLRILGGLTILCVGVFIVSMVTNLHRLAQLGPGLATIGYFAYVAMWRPYVELSEAGVTFQNIVQKVSIPWPTITGVSTRWSLTVKTQGGDFNAWALPATPSGVAPLAARSQTHRTDAPAVARLITEQRQTYADAGYFNSPAARKLTVSTQWDVLALAILGGGVLLSVVAFLLG